MKLMVTGHRIEKLSTYDIDWVRNEVRLSVLMAMERWASVGMSGMASGVDIWFCQACQEFGLPYVAYVPFAEQADTMTKEWAAARQQCLEKASEVIVCRNRVMVESCDLAIVVWDGNKGGTHNCFQQLLELNKQFYWIIPQRKQTLEMLNYD